MNVGIETCYVNEKYFDGSFLSSKEKGHSTLNNDKKLLIIVLYSKVQKHKFDF